MCFQCGRSVRGAIKIRKGDRAWGQGQSLEDRGLRDWSRDSHLHKQDRTMLGGQDWVGRAWRHSSAQSSSIGVLGY